MSNAPQTTQAPKNEYSNQSKTAQAGTTPKKNEPTIQSGKDNMKNEGGGSCSTSDKKSA